MNINKNYRFFSKKNSKFSAFINFFQIWRIPIFSEFDWFLTEFDRFLIRLLGSYPISINRPPRPTFATMDKTKCDCEIKPGQIVQGYYVFCIYKRSNVSLYHTFGGTKNCKFYPIDITESQSKCICMTNTIQVCDVSCPT